MSFLTPLFLIGLAGLAIPVLIHLIQRERKNVVQFPSLMFLNRIPYQSVQRRRIRHWALLLMRLGALALIVFAFARPFLRRTDAAGGAAGAREVVILVDRSYSMGYGDRWQRALGAARDVVNGLSASDRGSVVFFASGPEVALRSTADKGRLLAALATVEPSPAATHYGPALKLAGSILSESALPRREVVLVTDFQRAGWQGAEGLRLPDGAALTPVDLGGGETINAAVTPVALERSMFSGQERVSVTAGVLNHGTKALDGVDVSLEVDGRSIQTKRVRVDAGGSASTTFDPLTLASPNVRASIRIAKDALDRDNVFHFVVSPGRPVRVVLAQRSGGRDANLYVARALGLGDAPRFVVTAKDVEAISQEDLQNADVAILNDVTVTSASPIASRDSSSVVEACWSLPASGELAAGPGGRAAHAGRGVDRSVQGTRRRVSSPSSTATRSSSPSARRAAAISRRPGSTDTARAPRHATAPCSRASTMVRRRWWRSEWAPAGCWCGSRRSISVGTILPLKPVFLPFVHQMARHLAGYREAAPWLKVGDVLDPSMAGPTPKRRRAAGDRGSLGPAAAARRRGAGRRRTCRAGILRSSRPGCRRRAGDDCGLQRGPEGVRPGPGPGSGRGGRSDRTRAGTVASAAGLPPSDAAQESAQRVWWYLLVRWDSCCCRRRRILSNRIRL